LFLKGKVHVYLKKPQQDAYLQTNIKSRNLTSGMCVHVIKIT
jgi:hypothetical protein